MGRQVLGELEIALGIQDIQGREVFIGPRNGTQG